MNKLSKREGLKAIIFTLLGFSWGLSQYGSNCALPNLNDFSISDVVSIPQGAEPIEMDVAEDGRVFWIEIHGGVKMFNPLNNQTISLANLPAYSQSDPLGTGNKMGTDDGVLGLTLDQNFQTTHWMYIYYSVEGLTRKYQISRFTLSNNQLINEKVLLELTPAFDQLCHTGGSLDMDNWGNLYLSTGDNSLPQQTSPFAPIDERSGRSFVDAQGTAGNTNDLRGKIIRITPIPFEDAESPTPGVGRTYTIPANNLFDENMDTDNKTRPEIYTMGHRNPYRIAAHPRFEGWVGWGEVGPDAGGDSPQWGSIGMEEYNLATKAGNFGWPYIIGNLPYNDRDFDGDIVGPAFDPDNLINDSPNNTGLEQLPSAQIPLVWNKRSGQIYTKSGQQSFTGNWGTMAMSGPIYGYDPQREGNGKQFPPYFDGAWFLADWTREDIKFVRVSELGEVVDAGVLISSGFPQMMDMAFGPEGSLYVMYWGGGSYRPNGNNTMIKKIEYTGNQNGSCFSTPLVVPKLNNMANVKSIFYTQNATYFVPIGVQKIQIFSIEGKFIFEQNVLGGSRLSLPNYVTGLVVIKQI